MTFPTGVVDVQAFDVSIAPGGTAAAPTVVNLTMPDRYVRRVEIIIPRGVNGVVGIALGAAGQQVYPSNEGGYFRGDDEKLTVDLQDALESGAWQLFAYNTGAFTHTFNVRFYMDLPGSESPAPAFTPLPSQALAPSPDAAVQGLNLLSPAGGAMVDVTAGLGV